MSAGPSAQTDPPSQPGSPENSGNLMSAVVTKEESLDHRLRPQSLEQFQGQESLKRNLAVFIQAARERHDSLDHLFLSGPPGLGKTTLAGIMSHEMGVEIRITSAPAFEKPKDLAGILTSLDPGAILFIDEIHRLRPVIEEMLYVVMEDGKLDWIVGQGPSARTIRIPLPSFTLVGATTRAGLITPPLLGRFGITIRINYYDDQEIVRVLSRSAAILGIDIGSESLGILARSARGTPRVANRLLRRVRDFAQVLGDGSIDPSLVEASLQRLGVDNCGLEEHDRRILSVIIDNYDGGPVGGETLAISVGESVDSLEGFYEPYLIRRGFLKRTPRGREVTALAYRHLKRTRNDAAVRNDNSQSTLF